MGELFPIWFPIFPSIELDQILSKKKQHEHPASSIARINNWGFWRLPAGSQDEHTTSGCCQLCNPPSGLRTWCEEARLPLRLLHILLRSFYHNSTLLKLEVLAGWQLAISRGLRGREASALRAASQQELCVFSLMCSDSLALPNEWSADERRREQGPHAQRRTWISS